MSFNNFMNFVLLTIILSLNTMRVDYFELFEELVKFIILTAVWLFAGFLIGASCSYISTAGGLNFDIQPVTSVVGVLILLFSIVVIRNVVVNMLGKILMLLYAVGLAIFGSYTIYESKPQQYIEGGYYYLCEACVFFFVITVLAIGAASLASIISPSKNDETLWQVLTFQRKD